MNTLNQYSVSITSSTPLLVFNVTIKYFNNIYIEKQGNMYSSGNSKSFTLGKLKNKTISSGDSCIGGSDVTSDHVYSHALSI